MPLVIAFAQKYERRIGVETLLTLMMFYSIAFAISWIALLAFWLPLAYSICRLDRLRFKLPIRFLFS